jgi:hypothetical protein
MDVMAPYNWPFPTYKGQPITKYEKKPKGIVIPKPTPIEVPLSPF